MFKSRLWIRGLFFALCALVWSSTAFSDAATYRNLPNWPIYRAGDSVQLSKLTSGAIGKEAISFESIVFRIGEIVAGLPTNAVLPIKNNTKREFVFPVGGIYSFHSGDSTHLLLVTTGDQLTDADIAFDFVRLITTGGSADTKAFFLNTESETFSFFHPPRIKELNCGPQAIALMTILERMGIGSRMIQWLGLDPNPNWSAHQDLEINLSNYGGWTLYDTHYGFAFRPGVTALDVFLKKVEGRPIFPLIRRFEKESPWVEDIWNVFRNYTAVGIISGAEVHLTRTPNLSNNSIKRLETAAGRRAVWHTKESLRQAYYGKATTQSPRN